MLNAQDVYTIKDAIQPLMALWCKRYEEAEAANDEMLMECAKQGLDLYSRIWDELDAACEENLGYTVDLK